jgi:hypothetical protein
MKSFVGNKSNMAAKIILAVMAIVAIVMWVQEKRGEM